MKKGSKWKPMSKAPKTKKIMALTMNKIHGGQRVQGVYWGNAINGKLAWNYVELPGAIVSEDLLGWMTEEDYAEKVKSRPDPSDVFATARYASNEDQAEAYEVLIAFKKYWHEIDIRDIGQSVAANVREIMHRLNVIAR